MSGSAVVLVLIVLVILFILALGIGLLVFVMKRGKKSAPAPAPAPLQPAEPRMPARMPAPPASDIVPPRPQAPPMPAPPPPAPVAAAPVAGPRTDAIDPALFETQRSNDRPTSPTGADRGTREQPRFETIASSPIDDYAPPELFATTPSVPPEVAHAGPRPSAHLSGPDGLVPLDVEGIKIGRHPDCDLIIPTPGASRQHAEVRFQDGAWVIEDLNSGNGTYVNGVRIRSHRLSPGDEVRVDQTVLTFGLGSR